MRPFGLSQHRQSICYEAITCEHALTYFLHLASFLPILKPARHETALIYKHYLQECGNTITALLSSQIEVKCHEVDFSYFHDELSHDFR
jgi:hypothetical protein